MQDVAQGNPPRRRALPASEIARNVSNFEIWSTHQGCEQVSYSDLPKGVKADIAEVFDVTGRLPKAWTRKKSKEYLSLSKIASPTLLSFISDCYATSPSLFSASANNADVADLYAEISIVYSAWKRMQRMRSSSEKWSEADYVANVYNLIRSPALRQSSQRVHCILSLPQPRMRPKGFGTPTARVLNARTVVPDCVVSIPVAAVRDLSASANSPFKVLRNIKSVTTTGSAAKGTSFRYQSTPRAQLPDSPAFEFVSSIWEDKKPVHSMLEDAYRQNRMATAAAVRHLHSLHIETPVLGLIWADGKVRAHIDWCKSEAGKHPIILSAPYPGTRGHGTFHEWQLERPGEMLQVFFLVKNIDRWTMGPFQDRVRSGINDLVDAVVNEDQIYEPWKRVGDLMAPLAAKSRKENVNISTTTDQSSPPQRPPKVTRARRRRS